MSLITSPRSKAGTFFPEFWISSVTCVLLILSVGSVLVTHDPLFLYRILCHSLCSFYTFTPLINLILYSVPFFCESSPPRCVFNSFCSISHHVFLYCCVSLLFSSFFVVSGNISRFWFQSDLSNRSAQAFAGLNLAAVPENLWVFNRTQKTHMLFCALSHSFRSISLGERTSLIQTLNLTLFSCLFVFVFLSSLEIERCININMPLLGQCERNRIQSVDSSYTKSKL